MIDISLAVRKEKVWTKRRKRLACNKNSIVFFLILSRRQIFAFFFSRHFRGILCDVEPWASVIVTCDYILSLNWPLSVNGRSKTKLFHASAFLLSCVHLFHKSLTILAFKRQIFWDLFLKTFNLFKALLSVECKLLRAEYWFVINLDCSFPGWKLEGVFLKHTNGAFSFA